jgi:hypothetical protein
MKKFYELPVVEITVFDVEDVITTSVTKVNTAEGDINQHINDITNNYAGTADAKDIVNFNSNSYTW